MTLKIKWNSENKKTAPKVKNIIKINKEYLIIQMKKRFVKTAL